MTSQAARVINSATVNASNTVTVSANATVSVSLSVTTSGNGSNDNWSSTSYILNGITSCVDTTDFSSSATYSQSFNITAPASNGSYSLTLIAHRNNGCNPNNDSNTFSLPNAIVVSNGGGGGGGIATFLDLFSSVRYNNNDGAELWSSDWSESGDNNDPASGDINITGNQLHLQDANNSIARSVNLSAYTSATLSFDYSVVSMSNANEWVDLEIRTNSGSWTLLQRFTGPNDNSGTYTRNIDSYISSSTEIRFATSSNMGNSDDFYVDNFAINASGNGGGNCSLTGLEGTYYNQNGTQRAYFTGSTTIRTDSQINFNWGSGSPISGVGNDDFSIRWEGYIVPDTSGSYTFSTRSDDGIRLYVDGNLIIDQWNDHAPRNDYASPITLTAGSRYPVVMEFYERGGGAVAELYWSGPGISRQFIPSANLRPPLCGNVTPPDPIAEFRFDELSWNGTSGEILDNTGNGNNGRALQTTNGVNNIADGKICRAGTIPNINSSTSHAIDTSLVPSTTASSAGTISFWFRSNTAWNAGGGDRTLFDASSNNSISNGNKYLSLQLLSNGRLRYGMEDTADGDYQTTSTSPVNAAADEWVHITVTWDLSASPEGRVWINGSEISFNNDSLSGSQLGPLFSLYMGDNRSSYTAYSSNRSANGDFDEVLIFDQALTETDIQQIYTNQNAGNNYDGSTRSCPTPALDHYSITFNGSGSTCTPKAITIAAQNSLNATVTDHTGLITISTSTNHGNWSKNSAAGTLTPTPDSDDNGSVNYDFVTADQGDIILDLSNSHAETLSITVTDGSIASTSATLTFSENAFVITQVDSLGDDVVAGRNHAFRAQMIRRDPNTGSCGVATQYNVSDVKAWITRHSDDPGGSAPTLITASESQSLPSSEPGTNNLTLPFVGGEAFFSLSTSDVGKYAINFKDNGFTFSDSGITTVIPGDSPTYIVRPFGFYVEASGNPAASSSGGAVFTTAGSNFTVKVAAMGWESADDSNNDGSPDNHSDTNPGNNRNLENNLILPSFGQEASPQTITLTSLLSLPSNGNDPGLSGTTVLTGFSGGADGSSSVKFNEVGIIEISAEITGNNYLGAGATRTAKALSKSGYVGRFKPSHFTLTSNTVTSACAAGSFTYMAQPFSAAFTLEAKNSIGATTQNYTGTFVKLDGGSGTINYYAIDNASTTPLSGRLANANNSFIWSNGSGNLTTDLTLARINTANGEDGPFSDTSIGFVPTDQDGVTLLLSDLDMDSDLSGSFDSLAIGSTDIRYGRLVLEGTHGPESAPLAVKFVTEYWNGSRFVVNEEDSCTEIPLTEITYPDGPLSGGNFNVAVGGGTSTGQYGFQTLTDIGFALGDANHTFTAPGSGNTGTFDVDVSLTTQPWLQFDWDSDGSYTDNTALPTATFSFGSYRGHDRLIYWREVLN